MDDRTNALKSLLNLKNPIEEIIDCLAKFDWDSDELIVLEVRHVKKILDRYLYGEFSEATVEAWANAVECRDDIGLSEENENLLGELVHELANPVLTQKLTHERAKALIRRLKL